LEGADAVEAVVDRCLSRLFALEEDIGGYRREFSEREDLLGTHLLLRALHLAVADAQRTLIEELRALPPPSESRRRDLTLRLIQRIASTVERMVGQRLDFIAQPHGREFDPIADAYTRLARTLADETDETEVIFRPSEPSRYALSSSLLDALAESLRGRGSRVANELKSMPTLVVLRYPAADEANVMQHLLVGHELAHLALRRRDGDGRTLSARLLEPSYDSWKRGEAAENMSEEDRGHVFDRAYNWFLELACDHLGMLMVGPAFFVALGEHSALRPSFHAPSSDEYKTHPHTAWRLGLLGQALEELLPTLGEDEGDGDRWSSVRSVIEASRASIPAWEDRVPDNERKIVEGGMDALRSQAHSILGTARYTNLARDLGLVWDKLDSGMVPAERVCDRTSSTEGGSGHWQRGTRWSDPVDWRSIINVGYFRWLSTNRTWPEARLEDWRAADNERRKYVALLRGSVELSEFQREAHELAEQLLSLDLRSRESNALG
jgi:hypothetical protein